MTAPDIQARLVEGGSRELDEAVLRAIGWYAADAAERFSGPAIIDGNVTTSVDAALGLAKRACPTANCFGVDETPKGCEGYVSRNNVSDGHWLVEGFAKTPAAALCIAILKAKALQDGRDG